MTWRHRLAHRFHRHPVVMETFPIDDARFGSVLVCQVCGSQVFFMLHNYADSDYRDAPHGRWHPVGPATARPEKGTRSTPQARKLSLFIRMKRESNARAVKSCSRKENA